jgi:hypothetical protein
MIHSTPRDDTSNDGTGGGRDRWRRGPRRAGVLAIIAGIALATVACSSSSTSGSGPSAGSSQAGGSTTYQKDLAYAQCMRSHGVPKFPDPTSSGAFVNTGQFNSDSSQFHSADATCRHLLPAGGQLSQSQEQQRLSQLLKLAQCMRSHGMPNLPDPTDRNGHVSLSLKGTGIKPNSPQFQSAQRACQSLMPSLGGGS